jgi:hypothetical protein
MGNLCCCKQKEKENENYIQYNYLNIFERQKILTKKMIYCIICKKFIINPNEEVVQCNYCRKIIGHLHCTSIYNMNHIECPICEINHT